MHILSDRITAHISLPQWTASCRPFDHYVEKAAGDMTHSTATVPGNGRSHKKKEWAMTYYTVRPFFTCLLSEFECTIQREGPPLLRSSSIA